ncbi:Outer membrane efflux protein [Pseudarcicella hirudinis]|uniref:Outer membrane efflux protein n=1 Tax=Pseudarcicella hirudinis TaxID=1079859 RepID=A0A1I5XZC0_9BACT|nr:TolC family protein [Pseudarcicella hirudinis]SFQ37293.1 Outer membrane efflux protein [Pseudarcicella hirudinis]
MFRYIFIILFIGNIFPAFSQEKAGLFSYDDFIEIVKRNHPLVKQANLLPLDAQTEIMQAKGQFDPKLGSSFDRKAFQGTDYYNRWDSNLKIPTYFGADFKVGYEQNSGLKLKPEESPKLIYAGMSVPIGQGLLIDARRATLRQAQIARQISEAEKIKSINKTILSASKDYWEWYLAYQQYSFIKEGLDLAETRFNATKERARIGEQAAIDSVEAKITLQDRQVAFEQAGVDWKNAGLMLSNYLWNEKDEPLELPENAIPPAVSTFLVDEMTLQSLLVKAKTHPELVKLEGKIGQLTIEERFRKELLKPQLDVSFNFLSKSFDIGNDDNSSAFMFANQKVGVNFLVPIFLRKERGKLQQIRIKQMQTGFEKGFAVRTIMNDVYASYNDVKNYEKQLKIQQESVKNQEIMLVAEKRKFEIGETSLFLLNARESKLIDMRVKVESLKSKYQKALIQLNYASGSM